MLNKIKSCYNWLRRGTIIVPVSSGIDFVNTPHLYSDRAAAKRDCQCGLMVCARGSQKYLDLTRKLETHLNSTSYV